MAGLTVTGNDINITAGDIARGLAYQLRRAMNLKRFTDRFTSAQLATQFGGTSGDWDVVKSAVGELNAINTTFQANRAFTDQISGLGDV